MNQMKRARCLLPGPAQREKPLSACLWGPAGCPEKGCLDEPECPTLCQRRESLSFTQSWAVTTPGSLLTWLWALNPQPVEKRLELEAGSFRRDSPPLLPCSVPSALTCGGVSHLQTLPAEPSRRLGSLSETPASRLACPLCGCLPGCQLLQWHHGERGPDFLPRGHGSSSRASGLFLWGWCKGHPLPPAGK